MITSVFETKTRFKGSDFSHDKFILFALEENDLDWCSKHVDPSMRSNPHRFRPPTKYPHWHLRTEEKDPHLHTGNIKSKY
jgi:hypothetical protein